MLVRSKSEILNVPKYSVEVNFEDELNYKRKGEGMKKKKVPKVLFKGQPHLKKKVAPE